MRVVAISQRVDVFPERHESRDALDSRLISLLMVAGFISVPVPNRLYTELPNAEFYHGVLDAWLAAVRPTAFVLSGGNDIGEYIERDLTEGWLMDFANKHKLPLLGICRGMQMMAHWVGTGLHPVTGHVRTRHKLIGRFSSEVNSYHNYSLNNCPEGFEVLARSEDGEIEAIGHQSLPWEGWMWHPEREEEFKEEDVQRIKELFRG